MHTAVIRLSPLPLSAAVRQIAATCLKATHAGQMHIQF